MCDAQIQKFESRNEYKVEQHRGPKDQKGCAKNGKGFLWSLHLTMLGINLSLCLLSYNLINAEFGKLRLPLFIVEFIDESK